jgi:alpha-mannosidase
MSLVTANSGSTLTIITRIKKRKTIGFRTISAIVIAVVAMASTAIAYDLDSDKCNFEVAVAHLDTHWGWIRDSTYNNYIPNTLHENFALFRSNPRYIFSFCGAFRYWIMENYGQNTTVGDFQKGDWDTLKAYIAKGKWALAGSMIDEIDMNMPCAEAMCRNFLYGNGYYEDRFGKRSFDIYLPDCFGFSYSLPTFANHFGVRGFSTQKFNKWGGWWAPVTDDRSIMKWQGPDGSFIYAAMNPGSYVSGFEVNTAAGDAIQTQSGMWIGYDYYGVGDRGGAPNSDVVSALCGLENGKINDVYTFPAASDSLFRMLDRLEKSGNTNVNRLFTYDGELILQTHGTGC